MHLDVFQSRARVVAYTAHRGSVGSQDKPPLSSLTASADRRLGTRTRSAFRTTALLVRCHASSSPAANWSGSLGGVSKACILSAVWDGGTGYTVPVPPSHTTFAQVNSLCTRPSESVPRPLAQDSGLARSKPD